MMEDIKKLTHEQILLKIKHRFNDGGIFPPSVNIINVDGENYIYKCYRKKSAVPFVSFIRNLIITREFNRLSILNGISGIPQVYHKNGNHGIILEYFEAAPISNFEYNKKTKTIIKKKKCDSHLAGIEPGCFSEKFFDTLRGIIEECHKRKVAHNDIRMKNLLIDKNGNPYLIDFDAALNCNKAPFNFGGIFFNIAKKCDIIHFLKIKKLYMPESITEDESAELKSIPAALIFFRCLKKIYKFLKHLICGHPQK